MNPYIDYINDWLTARGDDVVAAWQPPAPAPPPDPLPDQVDGAIGDAGDALITLNAGAIDSAIGLLSTVIGLLPGPAQDELNGLSDAVAAQTQAAFDTLRSDVAALFAGYDEPTPRYVELLEQAKAVYRFAKMSVDDSGVVLPAGFLDGCGLGTLVGLFDLPHDSPGACLAGATIMSIFYKGSESLQGTLMNPFIDLVVAYREDFADDFADVAAAVTTTAEAALMAEALRRFDDLRHVSAIGPAPSEYDDAMTSVQDALDAAPVGTVQEAVDASQALSHIFNQGENVYQD